MQKEVVTKMNNNKNTIKNNNKNTIKNKQTNKISKNKTCRPHKPFEKNVELIFKKQKIDFESTNYNLSKELLKDVKRAVNAKGIQPTDDFYAYINDRWLDNKFDEANYKYIVQYDNFRIVQDKVFNELLVITDNFIKKNIADKSGYEYKLQKDMSNFLHALNDNDNNNEIFSKIVHNYTNTIHNLCKDKKQIWKMLAFLNNNEITSWGAPIVWKVNPDDKNPKIYKTYIGSPKLTLNDISLYFKEPETEYEKNNIKEYRKYTQELFEYAFGKKHNYNINDVYECEKILASSLVCNNDVVNDPDYNLVTKDECIKKFNFDWEQFTIELGYKTVPPDFVCSSKVYLYCITNILLSEWNSKQWQTYYIYIFIREIERWLLKGREIVFNFLGKFVQGQVEMLPQKIFNIYSLGFAFPNFYNNEYIKHNQNDEVLSFSKAISEDLKQVFIRIIKRNNWLEPQTKQKALEKLNKFKINIGSLNTHKNDTLFNFNPNNLWENISKVALWRKSKFIELDGKEVQNIPMIDWSMYPPKFLGKQSFIVNAMYTPSENTIDVPLGYLQKPFVDLEDRGIEYNLAHLGFTLAHEMSHSLDDWGSKYNSEGKLENWWTDKDRKKFEHIQKDVIKQYEKFALYDGIKFNALPSIGEDLADISGLGICVEYLRDFQLKNQDILPIKRLSFQVFFVYFAFQQRQKLNKKAIQSQLLTNPHPLDKYRTNVPLSRLEIFREIYNVKKDDKMWWHSTNKVWMD
jgi:predicted metalloendopeptidase